MAENEYEPSQSRSDEDWQRLASKELGDGDPDRLVWQTPEGIPVQPI